MTDHAHEAVGLLAYSDEVGVNSPEGAQVYAVHAQVHATLALAEQQRIANLIVLWMNDSAIVTDDTFDSVKEQIKAGLGL